MKYPDRDNGHEKELENIIGTTFWSTKNGELYEIENGTCVPVSPRRALESILKREKGIS